MYVYTIKFLQIHISVDYLKITRVFRLQSSVFSISIALTGNKEILEKLILVFDRDVLIVMNQCKCE